MTNGKILLVEDSEDDIMLTLRALNKNHMLNEVVIARDGVEALNMIYGINGMDKLKPSLVLMDLNMPKLGGLEVLKKISADKIIKCPVIILTTSNEEDDIVKSYELGANSYIRKPVEFAEFTETVSQLGMYWLMLNEPIPDNVG